MKTLLTLTVLLFSLAPVLTFADANPPKHEETELGETMDRMNTSWRKLRRQIADANLNASSLELVAKLKAGAEKALTYPPDLARDIPADKRDAFIAGYQAKMKEVIAALGQLEALLTQGDNPAAVELIAKIAALQKAGHKEYKRPE